MIQDDVAKQLQDWQERVNLLCHKVFFQSNEGHELLKLWEQRYFYAPVADPNVSVDYARFYEGRNNFIRGISACAYQAQKPKIATQLNKEMNHEIEND